MPIYEHRKPSHLNNPQLSGWLYTLPPLGGKHVLIIGTRNAEIINSVIDCDCKSISYIGKKHFNIHGSIIDYAQDLNSLTINKFDFCIIDDIEYFCKLSFGSLQTKLKKCFSLLNNKGMFLIGMPGGLKKFVVKLIIRKRIKKIGFKSISSFVCVPSFKAPIFIYPFSQAPMYTKRVLTEKLFKNWGIKNLVKDIIKFILFKFTIYNNPLLGTFITAAKSNTNHCDENLHHITKSASVKKKEIYTILLSRPYLAKQVGFIFRLHNNERELLAVCKQANKKNHRVSAIEDENNALKLFSSYYEIFNQENIVVPKPICFGYQNERIKSLESAINGIPISYTGLPLSITQGEMPVDLLNIKNILIELISKQIFIQGFLTKKMRNKLPQIDAKYFENFKSFSNEYFENNSRLNSYKNFVQHGDYTMVNFLYDTDKNKWGIIDWEWLAAGYPPLFDLFYLFTSVRFRETDGRKYRMFENDFQSFIETFFKNNWFSEFIYEQILYYCSHFKIDRKLIYNYFLDYLLFNFNKFRLDFNLPQFENLYKDMIRFSLKHEDKFLFKII